jgi:tetratricopeptide (TPR) repeat protein
LIDWQEAERERVAPPAAMDLLLRKALAADPSNANLHLQLGLLGLDRFDYRAAAAAFEDVLRIAPQKPNVRIQLAGCYNSLGLHERALEILADRPGAHPERGIALEGLKRFGEAQAEFGAVLRGDPHNRQACRRLCKSLRKSRRWQELLSTCDALAERGVRHSQFLYDWGIALALGGQSDRAARILFDRSLVSVQPLPPPEGADAFTFNSALAEAILSNPERLSDFVAGDAANRGSSRVHSLMTGEGSRTVRRLLRAIEAAVDAYVLAIEDDSTPWAGARPGAARLNAWAVIQRGDDFEDWHIHRDGWISGVYYVRMPSSLSTEGGGRGCIEYGPPPALDAILPDAFARWRCAPEEGMLLLAPSHYSHRTIPTEADEYRISFAFDVVPR